MLTLKWLGQAGYLLSDGETTICIDPYLSDVVNRVAGRARQYPAPISPAELRCDVMICTHDHLDHIDIDAIPEMKKDDMIFYAPASSGDKLRSLGVADPRPFDEGDTFTRGRFHVRAMFAKHSTDTIGVLITHEDTTMYFTSDTLYDEKLEEVSCDILFICINGKLGNMTAEEAVKVTRAIKPTVAVPNHYEMFASNSEDPHAFTDHITCGKILEVNQEYKVEKTCLI